MTTEQLIYQYFWHIFFIAATGFYAGYKVGQWWEQQKYKEPPEGDNGIWW